MRLLAQTLGIQSCLVREFDSEQMTALLDLPRHVRPLIMIALGYSAAEAKPLPRLPIQDYVHHESW
jgi:nitroreductase